jgi:hypothetical protein
MTRSAIDTGDKTTYIITQAMLAKAEARFEIKRMPSDMKAELRKKYILKNKCLETVKKNAINAATGATNPGKPYRFDKSEA